jgi:hypothetical protein
MASDHTVEPQVSATVDAAPASLQPEETTSPTHLRATVGQKPVEAADERSHAETVVTQQRPAAAAKSDPPAEVMQPNPPADVTQQHPPSGCTQPHPPAGSTQPHPPADSTQPHPPAAVRQQHPQVDVTRTAFGVAVERRQAEVLVEPSEAGKRRRPVGEPETAGTTIEPSASGRRKGAVFQARRPSVIGKPPRQASRLTPRAALRPRSPPNRTGPRSGERLRHARTGIHGQTLRCVGHQPEGAAQPAVHGASGGGGAGRAHPETARSAGGQRNRSPQCSIGHRSLGRRPQHPQHRGRATAAGESDAAIESAPRPHRQWRYTGPPKDRPTQRDSMRAKGASNLGFAK